MGIVGQAAALFAITNVDDLVLLALYFAQADARRTSPARVVAGQYLGFAGILAVAVAGALGASLLPDPARAYLGLIPLALGLRAAWRAVRERHGGAIDPAPAAVPPPPTVRGWRRSRR